MRRLIFISSCMLLCSAVMAEFNGTDNFNDNIRNPAKWIPYGPDLNLLSETNAHLEFTSTGVGHEQDSWIWDLNAGSYTQDWYAVVDTANLTPQGSIGIVIGNSMDFGDNFTVDLRASDPFLLVSSGWQINGTSYWFAANHVVSTNALKLKIAFDSATKQLSSSYDSGSGFTTLTNLNVDSWTMVDTDAFVAAINSWSESYAVVPNTLYADNFSAVTPSAYAESDIFLAAEVGWLAFAGVSYQVQYADDLLSTNWNNIGDAIVGIGSTNYVFDSTRNSTRRFYRVQVIE